MNQQPKKKKTGIWSIGIIILVLVFCILIWEGGKATYQDHKQEIYDTGYNQSYIDTIMYIAQLQGNTGDIIYIQNGSIVSKNIKQICGDE